MRYFSELDVGIFSWSILWDSLYTPIFFSSICSLTSLVKLLNIPFIWIKWGKFALIFWHPSHSDLNFSLTPYNLLNKWKLYETERFTLDSTKYDESKLKELAHPRFLFDGVTSFAIGGGDLIRDMINRIHRTLDPTLGGIHILSNEIIERILSLDAVFTRLRSLHKVESTIW